MARKRRQRRRFNLRKVRVYDETAIGALASLDVIVAAAVAASTNPYRLMSIDASYSVADVGAFADDSYEFGLSHSNYTAAEVEECLEATTAIDIGDKVAQERANRLVRPIGIITSAVGTAGGATFNNGMPVKTKLNWHIGIGNTLNVWIRNGSGNVYTTGATLVIAGNIWIKDAV